MPRFLVSFHCSETPEKPDIYEVTADNRKVALIHAAGHNARRYDMNDAIAGMYIGMLVDAFDRESYTMDNENRMPVLFDAEDEGCIVQVTILPLFNVEVPEARLVNVAA